MNGKGALMTAFLGSCAVITWRDFKNPDKSWPFPLPPPYRYAGAAVAFGLLSVVGDFFNEKIATVIGIGLFIGLAFQTTTYMHGTGTLTGGIGKQNPLKPSGNAAGGPISGTESVS